MPADTSYANRFKRLSGLTISNFRLSQPNLQPAATVDNTYYTKSNVSNAAPINIVNSAVQDFNDPRLFTASFGSAVVPSVPVIPDPIGTVYLSLRGTSTVTPTIADSGFTKSIDNGLTWSAPIFLRTPPSAGPLYSLLILRYDSKLINMSGTSQFITNDYGTTWTSIPFFTDNFGSNIDIYISKIGNIIFGRASAVTNNIVRTTDLVTWTRIPITGNIYNIKQVGATTFIGCGTNGTNPNTNASIYISTDSGVTWGSPINVITNLILGAISDIAILGTTLFAVGYTSNGTTTSTYFVSSSTNGGTTWSAPYTIASISASNNSSISILVAGTNLVINYIDNSISTSYIITSINSGVSWLSPVNIGLSRPILITAGRSIVQSGANIVATLKDGVSVSTDNGITWSFVSIPGNSQISSFYNGPVSM